MWLLQGAPSGMEERWLLPYGALFVADTCYDTLLMTQVVDSSDAAYIMSIIVRCGLNLS